MLHHGESGDVQQLDNNVGKSDGVVGQDDILTTSDGNVITSDGNFLRTADGNILTDQDGNFLTSDGNILKPEEAQKLLASQGVSLVQNDIDENAIENKNQLDHDDWDELMLSINSVQSNWFIKGVINTQ